MLSLWVRHLVRPLGTTVPIVTSGEHIGVNRPKSQVQKWIRGLHHLTAMWLVTTWLQRVLTCWFPGQGLCSICFKDTFELFKSLNFLKGTFDKTDNLKKKKQTLLLLFKLCGECMCVYCMGVCMYAWVCLSVSGTKNLGCPGNQDLCISASQEQGTRDIIWLGSFTPPFSANLQSRRPHLLLCPHAFHMYTVLLPLPLCWSHNNH